MKKQRGMALLMVLLMMSLMAIVAVNINDHWQRSLARTQSQQDRLRAKWLLLGGEIYAQQRWRQAGEQRKAWGASGPAFSMRTEEGEVAIRLRRVDACFNVNALIRAAGSTEVGDSEGAPPNKEADIHAVTEQPGDRRRAGGRDCRCDRRPGLWRRVPDGGYQRTAGAGRYRS